MFQSKGQYEPLLQDYDEISDTSTIDFEGPAERNEEFSASSPSLSIYHDDINTEIVSNIQHLKKCMSITQSYSNNPAPFHVLPGTERLFYNAEKLTTDTPLRALARKYTIPCVYDLKEHENEIAKIFAYMEQNSPRTSPRELEKYKPTPSIF